MMIFGIERFNNNELDELARRVNLDEKIDYGCKFITARDSATQEILGVAGVNFDKAEMPRFEHIIVDKPHQHGRLSVLLMNKMEEYLRNLGHKCYVAFIFNENIKMSNYAKKFGFQLYKNGIKGTWYYKKLKGEDK